MMDPRDTRATSTRLGSDPHGALWYRGMAQVIGKERIACWLKENRAERSIEAGYELQEHTSTD